MPRPETAGDGERGRRTRAVLALLFLVVVLAGLGSHDLWNPDEPRYAQVARTMLETGQYVLPQLNGAVYSHKPPLLFWSIAAVSAPFGDVSPWTARLPSALAAWCALLLVHDLGRRLFPDGRTALFAALAFGSSWKILWQSHVGQIDMLLACLVLAAVACWVRSRLDGLRWIWGFWLCTGLATLAKGPVGLLPPLLAIVVHLGIERDGRALRRLRAGRGLMLWAGVVLCWLVPAIARGGTGYMRDILLRQNVTRYVDPWHHHQPFHYYLTTALPADFLPWFWLLPACGLVLWRSRDQDAAAWRWTRFLVTWVLVTLVFFSLSPAKRTVYVLSMYPALALLVGRGMALVAAGRVRLARRWLLVPTLFLAGLGGVIAGGIAVLGPDRPELAALDPAIVPWTVAAFALFTCGALVAACFWGLRRSGAEDGRGVTAGAVALATGMVLFAGTAFSTVLPRFDPVKSAAALAARMDELLPPEATYGIHPTLDPTFLFYAPRRHAQELPDEAAVRAWLAAGGALLVERDTWTAFEDPPPVLELARDADPHDGYLLLRAGEWPTR